MKLIRLVGLTLVCLLGAVIPACSPTPFGYVLGPIEEILSPTATPTAVAADNGSGGPNPGFEAELNIGWTRIRAGPGLDHAAIQGIGRGTRVRVLGRSTDPSWLFIDLPGADVQGWLWLGAIDTTGLPSTLPIVDILVHTPTAPPGTPTRPPPPTSTSQLARTVTINFVNELPVVVYVRLSGPVDEYVSVPARKDYTVRIAAGTYSYSFFPAGYAEKLGTKYFASGDVLTWTFSVSP